VKIFEKSNPKIIKTKTKSIPFTFISYCLGAGTSVKGGRVKLD
jgi:hypothetical protein